MGHGFHGYVSHNQSVSMDDHSQRRDGFWIPVSTHLLKSYRHGKVFLENTGRSSSERQFMDSPKNQWYMMYIHITSYKLIYIYIVYVYIYTYTIYIYIISSSIVNVDDQEGDAAATLATPIGDEAATATLAFVFFLHWKTLW